MAKLTISQKQYDAIVLHEQKTRLNASTAIITETLDPSVELLEEGWKEVVLGVALMLGVGLTGANKAMAQNAVKNATTMSQVKATLEDSAKTQELVKLLKDKGMKDPEAKLAQNAEKVIDSFNDIASDNGIKYNVDTKAVTNLQALKTNLEKGYALKKATVKNDTIKSNAPVIESIQDTMDINLGSDNLFVTGGYTLSTAGADTITSSINEIKKQGGKIISVEIESSTDAEEIVKFINSDDPTGNIKLSDLRTKSVADLVNSLETGVSLTHREIPNNGSNVVSTQEFKKVAKDPKATATLRAKTAEYRYVKLKIVAVFEPPSDTHSDDTPKVIQHYRFELVKVVESNANTHKIKGAVKFQNKKFKCTKPTGKHSSVKCTCF